MANIKTVKAGLPSGCSVTACIYENFVLNPVWLIGGKVFKRILNKYENLNDIVFPSPCPSDPGYKMLEVTSEKFRIVCRDETVTFYNNNIIESKHDKGGIIENLILNTAPEDIIKEINFHLNCIEEVKYG